MSSDKVAMKGGAGAADYGVAIYGSAGSQHAGASGSIAMNSPSAYGAPMSGGRRRNRRSGRKGRKSNRRRGSSRRRGSRR